ncbi:MAG: phosphotransacetylase family protein [Desulfurococcaceae archaeon]
MVKSIYITGLGYCGKTIIAYGLLRKLIDEGLKASYFKPISIARKKLPGGKYIDTDVIALKEALSLSEPIEVISPIVLSDRYIELRSRVKEVRETVEECYRRIIDGKDAVVIESHGYPETLLSIGCSVPELAKLFNSKVVFVAGCRGIAAIDQVVDKVLLYEDFMEKYGYRIHGVLLNGVQPPFIERVRELLVPVLESAGIKVFGIISERRALLAPTVRDIVEALGAEVLEGESFLSNVIEDVLIGAMSPENALKWFRRAVNAAIITGGDRSDLILQAIETKPSVIILTGNLYPSIKVLVKAREVGIPVLLVPYDTYTTVEKLSEAQSIITPESLKVKGNEIVDVIEKSVDWKSVVN